MGSGIRKFCRRLCAFTLLVCVVSLSTLFLTTAPAHAAAGINQELNFQGRLLDSTGAIVPDGYYNIEFKIYQDGNGQSVGDTSGSPAGTLEWTEDYVDNNANAGVQVVNGYLSVQLGSNCPFSGGTCQGHTNTGVNWNSDTLWLSMNVAGDNNACTTFGGTNCTADGEMIPMKRLSSNAYALNSQELGGLSSGNFVQLAQGLQTDASTNNSIYINKTGTSGNIIDLQTSGVDTFMVDNSGDVVFGANAGHSISIATAAASTAGQSLTVGAGAAGSGTSALAGGTLTLQAGAGGGTNGNGGNLVLDAGAPNGTGTAGTISIGTNDGGNIQLGNATNTTQVQTHAGGASTTLTNTGGQKVQGSDSTSATNAMQVVNGSGSTLFQLVDNGAVNLGINPASSYAFGYNTVGTSGQDAGYNDVIAGQQFTPTSTGTLSSISVYAGANVEASPYNQYQIGIYTDNSGTPGSYIASSAVGTLKANAWNTLSVNASVTANTAYWLVYTTNVQTGLGSDNGLAYTSPSTGNTHFYATFTFGSGADNGMPASISGATITSNYADSIYASGSLLPAFTIDNQGHITSQTTFKNAANSTVALQVQNSLGDQVLAVDTTDNQVVLGQASQINGQVLLQSTGGGYAGLAAPNIASASSYSLTLPASAPTANNQCLQSSSTFTQLVFGACGTTGSFINNAYSTTQAGNYNIQGISSTAAVAVLEANNGGTGDILDMLNGSGTVVATFDKSGNLVDSATGTSSFAGTLSVATAVETPTLDTASAVPLNIGTTNATQINLNQNTQITGNQTFAAGSDRSISVAAASSGAGNNLTISAGNATTSGNGGNLILQGGSGAGTGAAGLVEISTPTFSTITDDPNCFTGGTLVASSCSIAQTSVDDYSSIVIGFSASGQTATLPNPTNTTPGRVFYIMAANGSQDFTLSANGGGTGNTVAMRQNTSATEVWNGTEWGAAGASSSTDLQAAYDNTLQSAGGAELVVSHTSNTDGLTIRDSLVNPTSGPLVSIQNNSAATLLSVNNNIVEYSSDGGAEVDGTSTTTFPANTWGAVGGATVSRYTTVGSDIATGQGSVSIATSATIGDGVSNTLSTALTANQHYNVSFAARLGSGSATFTTLEVYYSVDGTTQSVACTSGQIIPTSEWTKVNCAFAAPTTGITSSNAILIQQADATSRTFYIDNLSVTIAADYSYATDGGVDDGTNFGTNWPAVGGATVSRSTTVGQATSDSAEVQTTGSSPGTQGISNLLSIDPLTNTLYRVTVYVATTAANFNDITIEYTPNNGTTIIPCVDYNTQTVADSTTNFTEITCNIQTDSTAVTTPYVYFMQGALDTTDSTYFVDTFSYTLETDTTPNVQIGGGQYGGPVTLLTVDRAASAPIASNNDAFLGSMYYDTTLGQLQCYEANGWGPCGASPDTVVTISPEFTNAVMHGTGVGTMTSDICSSTLHINDGTSGQPTVCGTNETYNFYRWTSPQASAQTYSIYVTYQLPSDFKTFTSGQTSIMGRTDSTNSTVQYEIFREDPTSGLTQCGPTVPVSTGAVSSWQTGTASGAADPSTCGFVGGDSIVFEIDVTASQDANAYVGNLNFTFSHQ